MNKEQLKSYRRSYYLKHQERLKQYSRDFRATHKEECSRKEREYRKANREIIIQRERQKRKDNPERWKHYALKRYGLTLDQYKSLLAEQKNCCAICRSNFSDVNKPQVDHCHNTSKARKILCVKCNMMIAVLEYPPDLLDKAIDYLNSFRSGVLR